MNDDNKARGTAWHQSNAALVAASILLPPVGLVLLWRRRGLAAQTRVLASLCIVALTAGYAYLLLGRRGSSGDDARYTALEQHRAAQADQAAPEAQAAAPAEAAAAGNTAQPAQGGAPAEAGKPADAAHAEAPPNPAGSN